jgi:hypothetical protein
MENGRHILNIVEKFREKNERGKTVAIPTDI